MFRGTTKELPELLELDYVDAASLVKILRKRKLAREVDKRQIGRRPSIVYEIPTVITITLSENDLVSD